ncbi:hypothetical protein ILUMI_01298 [Ignelater luminosus]|uniref:Uncharacterized protein n=1 Tax=Ignelater luminosus TaxID=2038154 RepID=A0A8K0DK99_IGNLU|nr:hypothetical protein ILUMI_01298 [Ignelater luminosus]
MPETIAISVKCRKVPEKERESKVLEGVICILGVENCPAQLMTGVKAFVHWSCVDFKKKWVNCNRTFNLFIKKYQSWLNEKVDINKSELANKVGTEVNNIEEPQPGSSGLSRGRPLKSFEELSKIGDSNKRMSVEKALAMYLDIGLSFRKYSILRSSINAIHPDTMPSYYMLQRGKSEVSHNQIETSDIYSEVDLQNLLDKTTNSIIKLIPKDDIMNTSLTLVSKLQLVEDERKNVLWQNPATSSTFYCRPIKFIFIVDESNENSKLDLCSSDEEEIRTSNSQ